MQLTGVLGVKGKNIVFARKLRKDQTESEKKLWIILRNRHLAGIKFRRQFPVDGYILDFYSPEYKLAIEADGGQHYEEQGQILDQIREKKLLRHGIKILRFSDSEILNNIAGVYEVIVKAVQEIKNSPHPASPEGRGDRQ